MKKTLILLSLFAGDALAMLRHSSRKLVPRAPISIIKPLPVAQSFALAPHTLQTFQQWMMQQKPKMRQLINKYEVVRRYDHLLTVQASGNSQVNSQIQMFNTIMQSIMNDPEQAEEILQFYNQLNQANAQVHKALGKMPAEFQQLLDKRVQQYALHVEQAVQAEVKVLTPMQRIKMFMIRTYPYLVASLIVGLQIVMLISLYFRVQAYRKIDYFNKTFVFSDIGPELQELFHTLLDAFSMDPIPISKVENIETSSAADARVILTNEVEMMVLLYPEFFNFPVEKQIFTLIHELRHIQQYSMMFASKLGSEPLAFEIPKDIVDLAASLGVSRYNTEKTILFGIYYSRALKEFDADLFAVNQLKNDPNLLSKTIQYRDAKGFSFDSDSGYLSGELIAKFAGSKQEHTLLGKMSQNFSEFVGKLKGENAYVRLLPDHIKQQAKQNRAKKPELQRFPKRPTENLFDHEW